MNRFLLGGWVARQSAFYFCVIAGSLSYSVWLGRYAFLCRLACSIHSLLYLVSRVLSCLLSRRCLAVFISTDLGRPRYCAWYA